MPLGEFWGVDNTRHQPVQGVCKVLNVVVLGFGLKNGDKQIAQLGGLDGGGPCKEVSKALREVSYLNIFSNDGCHPN